MPKRLSIQAHLSCDELERRYRAAKAPVARSHWQIIWLLVQGLPSEHVAAVTGDTVNWVRSLAQRYNQTGPAGLGDQRHRNPGRVGLLSMTQRATSRRRPRGAPTRWRRLDGPQSGGMDGGNLGASGASATGLGAATAPGLDVQGAETAPPQG